MKFHKDKPNNKKSLSKIETLPLRLKTHLKME